MKNSIFISLLLICISANAQTVILTNTLNVDSVFSSKLTGELFYENSKYIGEQYYNKDWVKGDILLSTGEMIYDKTLKYNGLFDELVWLNPYNFGKFKLDKSFISEFWLKNIQEANIHFKRLNVSDVTDTQLQDIFVEVKVEGKMSLYIQHKILVVGSEEIKKNNTLYSLDDIESRPRYYIKLPSNHYLMLTKVRRLAFLRLFPEKKKAISKIIRDNHLNIKIESDFVKAIDLINKEAIF